MIARLAAVVLLIAAAACAAGPRSAATAAATPAQPAAPAATTPTDAPANAPATNGTVAETPAHPPGSFAAPQPAGTAAWCVVMNEEHTIDENTPHLEYKGRHYYFCCPHCVGEFQKNPDRYAESGE